MSYNFSGSVPLDQPQGRTVRPVSQPKPKFDFSGAVDIDSLDVNSLATATKAAEQQTNQAAQTMADTGNAYQTVKTQGLNFSGARPIRPKAPNVTDQDRQWHLGMSSDEYKRLLPQDKQRVNTWAQRGVVSDDQKRAQGQTEFTPNPDYQNQMRQAAGLRPLAQYAAPPQLAPPPGQTVDTSVLAKPPEQDLRTGLGIAPPVAESLGANILPKADVRESLRPQVEAKVREENQYQPAIGDASKVEGPRGRILSPQQAEAEIKSETDRRTADLAEQQDWQSIHQREIDQKAKTLRAEIRKRGGPMKWLTEVGTQGAAGLMRFTSGAIKQGGQATGLLTGGAGVTDAGANKLRIAAAAAQQAALAEGADRNTVSRWGQGVLAGLVSSVPALAAMNAGVPTPLAFAGQGVLESAGSGGSNQEQLKAGVEGAKQGLAWEVPGAVKMVKRPVLSAIAKGAQVGVLTGSAAAGEGKSLPEVLESGLTNAVMAGGGQLIHGAPKTEASLPGTIKTPIEPEPVPETPTIPESQQNALRASFLSNELAPAATRPLPENLPAPTSEMQAQAARVGRMQEIKQGQNAPQLQNIPGPPIEVQAEGAKLNRWQHRDFGLVTESENQSGVGVGRVRVLDEQGIEHIIKRSKGTGAGNQIAVPIREAKAPELTEEEQARADEAAGFKVIDKRAQPLVESPQMAKDKRAGQPTPLAENAPAPQSGSVLSDEQGKPITLYRGVQADRVHDQSKLEDPRTGIYLTSSEPHARLFGEDRPDALPTAKTEKFHVKLKNPLVYDAEAKAWEYWQKEEPDFEGTDKEADVRFREFVDERGGAYEVLNDQTYNFDSFLHDLTAQARRSGNDGLVVDFGDLPTTAGSGRPMGKIVVVWNPETLEPIRSLKTQMTRNEAVLESKSVTTPAEAPSRTPETIQPEAAQVAPTPEAKTGIARRVEDARRAELGRESVTSSKGISAEDSVQHGRELLSEGRNPEDAVKEFQKNGAISADAMALVRAKHEELTRAANKAFDEGGQRVNNPEFQKAEKVRQDWWENSVRPMQTEWHKTGMAQQGETGIDSGTFYGLYRAFKDRTGKEMSPEQSVTARNLSSKVAESDAKVQTAEAALKSALGQGANGESGQNPSSSPPRATAKIRTPRLERIDVYFDRVAQEARARVQARTERAKSELTGTRSESDSEINTFQSQYDRATERVRKLRADARTEDSNVGPIHQALEQAEKSARGLGMKLSAAKKSALVDKGQRGAGINPVAMGADIADYAVIGAAKLAKSGITLAKWSADMASEFGEDIKPHLDRILLESRRLIAEKKAQDKQDQEQRVAQAAANKTGESPSDAALRIKNEREQRLQSRTDINRKVKEVEQTEKQSANAADFRDTLARGIKPTSKHIATVWDAVKPYVDQGDSFSTARQKAATDLGIKPEQVSRTLAQKPEVKRLTDEMYRQMSDRRSARAQAEAWVRNADTPRPIKALKAVRDAMFNIKVGFGLHGTVGPVTHAGENLFHPSRYADYFRNVGRTWKAVLDKGYHEKAMQNLEGDSNYITAKRAGLANDPHKFYDDYQNSRMQKMLGSAGQAGNRGFDVLKIMRQDFFNSRWNRLPDSLKTPDMAQRMAQIVNHSTGAIGSKLPGGELTHSLLFAGPLEASRWARLIKDPGEAIGILGRLATGQEVSPANKYFLKSVAKQTAEFAATYGAALALNQGILMATGSKDRVNLTDPSKGDFLRFKIKGRAIEPTGGMIGAIDFLGKLGSIAIGKETQEGRGSRMGHALYQYGRGKLSPIASTAADVVTQADYGERPLPFSSDKKKKGKPRYSWGEYLATQQTPIPISEAVRDVNDTMRQQGVPGSFINTLLSGKATKPILKGIAIGALSGSTGIRIGQEYPERADQAKHTLSGIDVSAPRMKPDETIEHFEARRKRMDAAIGPALDQFQATKEFQSLDDEGKKKATQKLVGETRELVQKQIDKEEGVRKRFRVPDPTSRVRRQIAHNVSQ